MLVLGLINRASPSYGRPFLKIMSSVYPGFHNSRSMADVLVGAGYGFVDGAVGGAAVAALYNQLVGEKPAVLRLEEQPLARRL